MSLSSLGLFPIFDWEGSKARKSISEIKAYQADKEGKCLIEMLAEAAREYKENMLKGLNSWCEDEIQERIAKFRAFITPENPTEQEQEQIDKRVAKFEELLRLLVASQQNESLINFGGKTAEDNEQNAPRFVRPPMSSNSPLQYKLQSDTNAGLTQGQSVQDLVLKKMSDRYEQMLAGQQG